MGGFQTGKPRGPKSQGEGAMASYGFKTGRSYSPVIRTTDLPFEFPFLSQNGKNSLTNLEK